MALQIEPFNSKHHNRLAFECGVESLDRYLRFTANQDLKKSLMATEKVASLAVIAEAIDEKAVSFYQRYGFRSFKLKLCSIIVNAIRRFACVHKSGVASLGTYLSRSK